MVTLIALDCGASDLAVRHRLAGSVFQYEVRVGDTLTAIGARFGVNRHTLAKDNGLRGAAALRVGQRLQIDNRHVVPDV